MIAGHSGVGLSQRAQSFVLDRAEDPFNVIQPGQRPRVTLTPTLALKDGLPYLVFSVQGGDSQDQNLLQFFLNVVEFGMTVQEATEAANINSFQRTADPTKIVVNIITGLGTDIAERTVREDATTVSVTVAVRQNPGTYPAIAFFLPVVVSLKDPLGDRTVLDAAGRPVRDAGTYQVPGLTPRP